MLIDITTHCTLQCPHCMQNASPNREDYMDFDTFVQTMDIAHHLGARIINVSGGECTTHPLFLDFLNYALSQVDKWSDKYLISIISNGSFTASHNLVSCLSELMKKHDNLFVQISSFKGVYTNYDDVHKPGCKAIRMLGKRCCVEDDTEMLMKKIRPMGRASEGHWFDVAKQNNLFPSCINPALITAQMPYLPYLKELEMLGQMCKPMVSWDGSVRMGESEQCKVIANVRDGAENVSRAMLQFRPCGKCASYKWHFENPKTEKEKKIAEILGIKNENK